MKFEKLQNYLNKILSKLNKKKFNLIETEKIYKTETFSIKTILIKLPENWKNSSIEQIMSVASEEQKQNLKSFDKNKDAQKKIKKIIEKKKKLKNKQF